MAGKNAFHVMTSMDVAGESLKISMKPKKYFDFPPFKHSDTHVVKGNQENQMITAYVDMQHILHVGDI